MEDNWLMDISLEKIELLRIAKIASRY